MATKMVPRTDLEVSIRSQVVEESEEGDGRWRGFSVSAAVLEEKEEFEEEEEEEEVFKSDEDVLSEMYSSSAVEIRW